MKKLVLLAAAAVLSLGAVSCKKDYDCSCTWKESHDDHFDDKSGVYDLGKVKEDDAKTACDTQATAISADPDHSEVVCDIKKK
jgi:hypothetical protein